jgi:pentatricopeptide repeat protein
VSTESSSDGSIAIAINPADSAEEPSRICRTRRKSNQPDNQNASLLPPLTEAEYDPKATVKQIHKASAWDQGKTLGERNSNIPNRKVKERKWDYEFVRSAVDLYERHLQYVVNHLKTNGSADLKQEHMNSRLLFANIHPDPEKCNDTDILVSPSTLASAVRALTRSRLDTPLVSKRIREIERLIGSIGWTPITEGLSYRLLEANGKAGNVRRTLALLELRRRRGYEPAQKEFIHVITSIQAAQLPLRRARNIYLHESALAEGSLDNPTRYLDAILVNMSQRGVPLTPELAAQMLNCYSSTGRTGRALHYFYKMVHDPIEEDGVYIPGPHPTHLGKEGLEEWKNKKRGEGMGRLLIPCDVNNSQAEKDDGQSNAYEELEAMKADDDESNIKTRVRMNMHPPPPFHKIPSAIKGAPVFQSSIDEKQQSTTNTLSKPMTKLEHELERDFSLSLTAAFAFADSLTHGACGHDPIELNATAWNALIKACCYRGAFHRALKILNETMPQKGVEPDSYSYNTILAGLARVVRRGVCQICYLNTGLKMHLFVTLQGDITSLKELLVKMTNIGIPVDKYTVQAMADGLLNIGDVSGASSIVQVRFVAIFTLIHCSALCSNPHSKQCLSNRTFSINTMLFHRKLVVFYRICLILQVHLLTVCAPHHSYTTHLKIIEFALANGLIFEAKRHVYFVQQLWKWQPSQHHSESFCNVMEATKRNPKLNKDALQRLFRYFGEELNERDFF